MCNHTLLCYVILSYYDNGVLISDMEKLPIINCEFINILLKFDIVYADIYIDIVCHLVYNIVILYKFLL